MNMDEKFFKQAVAQLINAQSEAFAILTQALCQQVDPGRLKTDLQQAIAAAEQMPGTSAIARDIVRHAMAAADAERMLQARPPGEGPHPTRG